MNDNLKTYRKSVLNLFGKTKRDFLKINILKFLYHRHQATVKNISEIIKISTPTTFSLINELLKEKWIEKKGYADTHGGRKPELYCIKPNSIHSVCIDIELFCVNMAIIDNSLQPITEIKSYDFVLPRNRENIRQIYTWATELIKQSGIDEKGIIGISIGMPGLIDTNAGQNYSYLNSEKPTISLQKELEELFGLPILIQNDVKGITKAELQYGKANGKKEVLVLSMDWGVGLGIVMNGKVQQGVSGFSGEMGHIPFVDNGDLCYCGKHGCLETVASGQALIKMAKEGILSGKNSTMAGLSLKDIDNIDVDFVIQSANNGDQYAIKLLSNIGTNMGKAISTLIQLFNPELIILVGKIAEAKQYITLPMRQAINTYCMTQIREKTTIVSSELGEHGRLFGYAINSFEHYFDTLLLVD